MAILRNLPVRQRDGHLVTEAMDTPAGIGEVIYRPGVRVPARGLTSHDGQELCYVAKGSVVFGTETEEVVVREGEFHCYENGVAHFCRNDESEESRIVYILLKQ